MSPGAKLDRALLAERASAVERHLDRVTARLPADAEDFQPATDRSDAVVLHLWLAVQIAIDLAVSTCVALQLGAPATYAEAFRALAAAGHLEPALSERLVRAAGFRNLVAHAYESIDMARVYRAAQTGPDDLRALLSALARIA